MRSYCWARQRKKRLNRKGQRRGSRHEREHGWCLVGAARVRSMRLKAMISSNEFQTEIQSRGDMVLRGQFLCSEFINRHKSHTHALPTVRAPLKASKATPNAGCRQVGHADIITGCPLGGILDQHLWGWIGIHEGRRRLPGGGTGVWSGYGRENPVLLSVSLQASILTSVCLGISQFVSHRERHHR